MSKAGVTALSQALADEVRRHGITVNGVLPGTLDTEASRRAMLDADVSRWVAPEAVARTIRFLVSDDAARLTGGLILL